MYKATLFLGIMMIMCLIVSSNAEEYKLTFGTDPAGKYMDL